MNDGGMGLDLTKVSTTAAPYSLIYNKPHSDWVCHISPSLSMRPPKGREPKWFRRMMGTLLLGWKWEKVGA